MEKVSPAGFVDQVFLRCVEDCFEPIMLTDRNGKLSYVNPAWVLTYGYQKDEALGQTPRLLRSAFQSDEFYRSMWKTILDPSVGFWRGEVMNKAKDGHLVPVLLTITPYRSAGGEIHGYMGIAVDLTEQKKMEQQILRQDRLASIGMIAGGLAHEVGNPLGVIRGRAELVLNQIRGNELAEKNLELLLGQIDRISELIRSLLKVSRVPDKILLREIDLSEAVQEVVTLMGESCRMAGASLRSRDVSFKIQADPAHLQQLFMNLVINSMHAIQEQKAKSGDVASDQHWIEISAEQFFDPMTERSCCRIVVQDTGCGISAENLKKLFQPFFTTKSAGQGTGLGLAIVSKLAEEMGGRVFAESPGVGQGATFKIEFALA